MTPIPNIQEALKDYRIHAHELWVVFVAASADAQAQGQPPVMELFFLAAEGNAGRAQIERIESRDPHYLASFSFLELQSAIAKLADQPVLEAKPRGLSRLFPGKTFFVPVSSDAHSLILQVKAPTLKDAVALVSERYPGQAVGVGGSREDVDALMTRMERTVSSQNFFEISTDRRDPIRTWDTNRLLFAKKNPDMAQQLVPYPEQSNLIE